MKKDLFFNEDGKFKILQLTDIHFTDGSEKDHRATQLMEQLIREEKPDFIIATGDTVYGPDNAKNVAEALKPVSQSGVAWSYTFGNHDTEEGEDYDVLFPIIEGLVGCAMYQANPSGSGTADHYLEVKNRQGETRWVLFGIDSGNYNRLPGMGGYAYIKNDQIQWYRQAIGELERNEELFSALVFMHIPLPEYREVWETQVCSGEKREGVCCSELNSGFFTAMLEAGHTRGVFAGHDHINDYTGTLHGITLGYGRATGYNTYGQEGYLRGARIILLDENDLEHFETYVRLEDGTVIKNPKLHYPGGSKEGEEA